MRSPSLIRATSIRPTMMAVTTHTKYKNTQINTNCATGFPLKVNDHAI